MATPLLVSACAKPHGADMSASPVLPWPRAMPCRTSDAGSPRVFVTMLGDVRTPLAEGVFEPADDRVRLHDGTIIEHYYRDKLGVAHYAPIDKSRFPLPPCGWCSWYYYYQQITPEEVKLNAEWMGRHLREYGARVCQLDDGWQGAGRGMGDNRDWTTLDKRFAAGLDDLTRYIRAQGLTPGIWLAPHGQSNPDVVMRSGAFLLDEQGATISDTWEGKFLVDPTRPRSHRYLHDLFRGLCEAGFDYFKIDGQPIVVDEYRKHAARMEAPPSDPVAAYRGTLETIRSAIGPDRFLLGCWGTPTQGVGYFNGCRIGGDIVQGLEGLKVGVEAILRFNYLHNVVWYADPDVLSVRTPVSADTARAWATALGLTGQALLTSDRLPDLPDSRVEILRRVCPPTDIRPLDLFETRTFKTIWDLKVAHLGRQYDVVGCFNFDRARAQSVHVRWADLGLKPDASYHVYDFWERAYLGCWEAGYFAWAPPAGCVVLTLVEAAPDGAGQADGPPPIVLLSTDRHITQGWIDLLELRYDAASLSYHGRSRLIGGAPYTLTFGLPRQRPTFRVASARAGGADVRVENHQGWATVTLTAGRSGEVDWRVTFEPAELYSFKVATPSGLSAEMIGIDALRLTWNRTYDGEAGYAVFLDGALLGVTPINAATVRDLPVEGTPEISVRSVWWDGTRSEAATTMKLEELYPSQAYLSDLEPRSAKQEWGSLGTDRSVSGRPLKIGDRVYRKGLGTHAESNQDYALGGRFTRFRAEAGVDANSGSTTAKSRFEVWADDRKVWESGDRTAADGPLPVDVDISGARVLRLRVDRGDDGKDYDHADWAEARIVRE